MWRPVSRVQRASERSGGRVGERASVGKGAREDAARASRQGDGGQLSARAAAAACDATAPPANCQPSVPATHRQQDSVWSHAALQGRQRGPSRCQRPECQQRGRVAHASCLNGGAVLLLLAACCRRHRARAGGRCLLSKWEGGGAAASYGRAVCGSGGGGGGGAGGGEVTSKQLATPAVSIALARASSTHQAPSGLRRDGSQAGKLPRADPKRARPGSRQHVEHRPHHVTKCAMARRRAQIVATGGTRRLRLRSPARRRAQGAKTACAPDVRSQLTWCDLYS